MTAPQPNTIDAAVAFLKRAGLRLPLAAWAVQWLANVDQDGDPTALDAVTELFFEGDESKAIQLMERVHVARRSPDDFGVESLGDIIEDVASSFNR